MRVLVTGATGFIGSRLRPLLAARGNTVIAIARPCSHSAEPEPNVTWTTCDVAEPDFVKALPKTVDVIVHLAQAGGSPPDRSLLSAVNVKSTRLLLDYSRRAGVRRFVLASSGSVYGGSSSLLREDRPRRPPDAYAQSKADAEALLEKAPAGLEVCALRLFAPYGPGQNGRLVAELIGRVSARRPVTLRGEGHPRLNPIFVDDVAAIVVRALETPAVPHVLNVAGEEVLSIREMADAIGRALGVSPLFERETGDPPPDLVADTTLLRRTLELEGLTSFEHGIAMTVGSAV